MTGFARVDGAKGNLAWTWEARSVNGKSLDVRCRLAAGFEYLEAAVRAEAGGRFKRGNITLGLAVSKNETSPRLRINRALLDEFVTVVRELDPDSSPRIDALLGLRGVIEQVEEEDESEREAWIAAVEAGLPTVLDRLASARTEEGDRLAVILTRHLDRIEALVATAGNTAALQPEALRARLREQVEALLDTVPALPEERLAQEAALLIARADVREELDRLAAHISQARELLSTGGPVGRRLDFLCQEFNREANTLCSKSADVELTRIGLDLKAVIEQFREQVQNIE
ncbi:MAG TPA: YicC/YloC family endoribonuclease [Alphaproteobacteria bacterium]|nr:YicC/YloC family endoribonuclease [Alphaproteobacteria bacterium]